MREESELQPLDLGGREAALEGGENRVKKQAKDDGAGQSSEQKSLGDSQAPWAAVQVFTHDTRLRQNRRQPAN